MIFREEKQLINYIADKIESNSLAVITVDGKNGSGKTYLSNVLSDKFNLVHFNVDDNYLIKNMGKYVDFVKFDELKNDILNVINDNNIALIDAVCVLQILDNICISSDLKIYIKKVIHNNYWFDGQNFDYSRNIDDIIQEDKDILKLFAENLPRIPNNTSQEYRESLFHDVLRYHFMYKPDLNSDIVYERQRDQY